MFSNTRVFDKVKYLRLHNENKLKELSLEDNVYFTLRDVFLNIDEVEYLYTINDFNGQLTNNIYYEDRSDNFSYTNVLTEEKYVNELSEFLDTIVLSCFYFEELKPHDNEEDKDWYNNVDMKKYIKFEDWWEQFEKLKKLIKNR
jgi:hypothetical protein